MSCVFLLRRAVRALRARDLAQHMHVLGRQRTAAAAELRNYPLLAHGERGWLRGLLGITLDRRLLLSLKNM